MWLTSSHLYLAFIHLDLLNIDYYDMLINKNVHRAQTRADTHTHTHTHSFWSKEYEKFLKLKLRNTNESTTKTTKTLSDK